MSAVEAPVPSPVLPAEAGRERPRVVWQPLSWPFWVYVALVVFALAGVFQLLSVFDPLPAWVLGVAIGSAVALGLLLLWMIRGLNVFRGTPAAALAAVFVWGACVAVAIAVKANEHLFTLVPKLLGNVEGSRWTAAIAGPTTEEWVKTMGVVVVVLIARDHIQRPIQGMFLGALCGLGFQLVENLSYAGNATLANPVSDAAGAFATIGLRSAVGLTSHWMYSALCGLGVGYLLTRRDRALPRRMLVAAVLVALGWAAHFLWNSPLVTDWFEGNLALVALLIKMAVVAAVFFAAYRLAMRSEWRWFDSVVAAEPASVITDEERASLRTRRLRRKARKRARKQLGRPAGRVVRRLQRAQLDLAGTSIADPAATSQVRAEIAELRGRLTASPGPG